MTGAALGAPQAAWPIFRGRRVKIPHTFATVPALIQKYCTCTGARLLVASRLCGIHDTVQLCCQDWSIAVHKSSTPSPCGRVVADADSISRFDSLKEAAQTSSSEKDDATCRLVTPASSSAASYEPWYSLHATQALSYRPYLRTANNYSTLRPEIVWTGEYSMY